MENKELDKVTLIEIYRPLIEERLSPTRIVLHIDFLTDAVWEQIKNEERNTSRQQATKSFLKFLIHSDEPGWYEKFRQALKENEYEYLGRLLDGFSDIKDERIPKQIMKNVAPKFAKSINPTEVLPYLEQHGVIDDCDAAEIKAICESRGRFDASFDLFLHIGRKCEDWFPKLAHALKETEYAYIFKDYIPNLEETKSYEDVKRILDGWIEKYTVAEESRPRSMLKSAAREFEMSFDGTESEPENTESNPHKTTAGNVTAEEDDKDALVPHVEPKHLELRPYQKELIERAVKGKNTLMVAPTGSGKTHMALAIIQHHLTVEMAGQAAATSPPKRAAFFVPTRCLVWQQWKMCEEYLSEYKSIGITGASKPGEKVAVGELLPQYDIIIMTPQILVEALQKNEVKHLGEFTLLIFDECHHAMKGHPYNDLMRNYRNEQRKRVITFSVPQVVGLTASVGVGKASNLLGAKEHILKLCANLDSPVNQIMREKESLDTFVNRPSEKMWEIKGRSHDPFYNEVSQIMQWIEAELLYSPDARELLKGTSIVDSKLFTPAGKRGTERYKQWLSQLDLCVSQIPSAKRRLFHTCCRHLVIYNDGLILNADCRAEDALGYITLRLEAMYEHLTEQQKDKNDRRFFGLFKEKEALLIQLGTNPTYKNPKLDGLKLMITRQMEQSENSRGIVFCRTRILSVALSVWASEDNDLKKLGVKAGRLTGARVAEEEGGMTQGAQDQVVKDFRNGEFRILIATSVGQEGIDIPDCNFVINYEHVTNEIARIQARGRGRAQGAKHITIGETERGTIQRENMNKIREDLMNTALSQLMKMDEKKFLQHKKRIQNELSKGEDLQTDSKKPEKPKPIGAKIMCKRCNEFVCEGGSLKIVKRAHHIVVDAQIWKKVDEKPHKKPTLMSDELWKKTKIHCVKCGQDWGIGGTYQDTKIAILKKGQALVYQYNRSAPKSLSEWKDLPFSIADLTDDEFNTYRLELSENS